MFNSLVVGGEGVAAKKTCSGISMFNFSLQVTSCIFYIIVAWNWDFDALEYVHHCKSCKSLKYLLHHKFFPKLLVLLECSLLRIQFSMETFKLQLLSLTCKFGLAVYYLIIPSPQTTQNDVIHFVIRFVNTDTGLQLMYINCAQRYIPLILLFLV